MKIIENMCFFLKNNYKKKDFKQNASTIQFIWTIVKKNIYKFARERIAIISNVFGCFFGYILF